MDRHIEERHTRRDRHRGRHTHGGDRGRGRKSCTIESMVYFEDSLELNISEPEPHTVMKPLDHFQITKLDKVPLLGSLKISLPVSSGLCLV